MRARSRSLRPALVALPAAALLVVACDASTPSPTEPAAFTTSPDGAVAVLAARLGALATSRASGYLVLEMRPAETADVWAVRAAGIVTNPAGETFTDAGVHPVPRDPDGPSPGPRVLTLFADERASCPTLILSGRGVIDASLARTLAADPGSFAVLFATTALPDGALIGVLVNPGPPNGPDVFTNPGPPNGPGVFTNPGPPNGRDGDRARCLVAMDIAMAEYASR